MVLNSGVPRKNGSPHRARITQAVLAKLYEHHAKDAARALALVEAGTGESEDRRAHRAARLARKVSSPSQSTRPRKDRGTTGKLW